MLLSSSPVVVSVLTRPVSSGKSAFVRATISSVPRLTRCSTYVIQTIRSDDLPTVFPRACRSDRIREGEFRKITSFRSESIG